MYFKLEYIGYWSQAEDSRLFPAQVTAKVNCSLLSIGSFRVAPILSKARIFGHICGLGECRAVRKLCLCIVSFTSKHSVDIYRISSPLFVPTNVHKLF